jgi:hypothetical protein
MRAAANWLNLGLPLVARLLEAVRVARKFFISALVEAGNRLNGFLSFLGDQLRSTRFLNERCSPSSRFEPSLPSWTVGPTFNLRMQVNERKIHPIERITLWN